MVRVVVLDPMEPDRLDRLRPFLPEGWELATEASRSTADQADALVGSEYVITGDMPVDAAMMTTAGLKAVHKWGVGYDNIDCAAATDLGVRVMRTTGSNAVAVAETSLALILSMTRNVVRGHVGIDRGEWLKDSLAQSSIRLSGRPVGIVGLGHIGQALAKLLSGFGCPILYSKRTRLPPEEEEVLNATFVPLEDLLASADVVSLNCELNDATRGLINAETLALMKPGALLVNASRGGVVIEDDVAASVKGGHLGGAAFDVFAVEPLTRDNPLLGLDRVVLTPHIGAVSVDGFAPTVTRMMKNFLAIENGQAPRSGDVIV